MSLSSVNVNITFVGIGIARRRGTSRKIDVHTPIVHVRHNYIQESIQTYPISQYRPDDSRAYDKYGVWDTENTPSRRGLEGFGVGRGWEGEILSVSLAWLPAVNVFKGTTGHILHYNNLPGPRCVSLASLLVHRQWATIIETPPCRNAVSGKGCRACGREFYETNRVST
jgi:hypothetical protein